MRLLVTTEEMFREMVAGWPLEQDEIGTLFAYANAGGFKSFEFFSSLADFLKCVGELPPQTFVYVFRHRQLPLRGVVDEAFIVEALAHVPVGAEYVIAGLELTVIGKASWYKFYLDDAHDELEVYLRDHLGERMAVGLYPFPPASEEEVLTAIVPMPDGSVKTGAY